LANKDVIIATDMVIYKRKRFSLI